MPVPPARLLVVDDNPSNRAIFTECLVAHGYDVTTANNGGEALAHISLKPPDLILLDVMMPFMDGFRVAERVRANPDTAHLLILIATSMDGPDVERRAKLAGADACLTKPRGLRLDRARTTAARR